MIIVIMKLSISFYYHSIFMLSINYYILTLLKA